MKFAKVNYCPSGVCAKVPRVKCLFVAGGERSEFVRRVESTEGDSIEPWDMDLGHGYIPRMHPKSCFAHTWGVENSESCGKVELSLQ